MNEEMKVKTTSEEAAATAPVVPLVIHFIWGSYELRPLGLLAGGKRIWRHNPLMQMTEQEQFEANRLNDPDFCREKYLPPVVRFVCG